MSSVAEKQKSAIHGGASRSITFCWTPRANGASQEYLQTTRTSYNSCRGRVARQRKRKLDRSRVVQKSNQIYPIGWLSRAGFPEAPQRVIALVPNVGPVGKYGV